MTTNLPSTDDLFGATVYGSDGEKIGKVDEVYLDNNSGDPEWVSVKTGLFGSNVSLIPLSKADYSGADMTVPFAKSVVKGAPHHDPGAELSEADERDLYEYYNVSHTDTANTGTSYTDTSHTQTTQTRTGGYETAGHDTTGHDTTGHDTTGHDTAGYDTSGPQTDGAMTRSKEELHVGTETREAGRARLRKYITSERVTREVPVSHEEVVVTREPITEANRGAAMSGGDLTEEEHEVVLREERAVVAKETVPVERVALGTETVTGTQTVEAELREEHIELDADKGVHVTHDRD